MKNKKLLKTVLCVTSGIGFATSIPFMTTACGSSSTKTSILPDEIYDIDQTGVLNGFKSGINLDEYNDGICDTMQIPASVTSIADSAFENKIPSFIKNLTFASGSNCSSIEYGGFDENNSLTSVTFPSSLTLINTCAFSFCSNLSSITWNAWQDGTTIDEYVGFNHISSTGTVLVINPVDSNHNSEKLLEYLKQNVHLPETWRIAS